jgi:hypothetical protein
LDTPAEDSVSSTSTQPLSRNSSINQDFEALMSLDIPTLKDSLAVVKEALANGESENALTSITDTENQLLTTQPQPTFMNEFQAFKDAIAKADLKKPLESIINVQIKILNAETKLYIAMLPTPKQLAQQNNDDRQEEKD